jgi:hypothetical protein
MNLAPPTSTTGNPLKPAQSKKILDNTSPQFDYVCSKYLLARFYECDASLAHPIHNFLTYLPGSARPSYITTPTQTLLPTLR